MEAVVDHINKQIGLLVTGSYVLTTEDFVKRVKKNLFSFTFTYVVVYYYFLLFTTLIYPQMYPSVITTFLTSIIGGVMVVYKFYFSVADTKFYFSYMYFPCCVLLPAFVSMNNQCTLKFVVSSLISLSAIVVHACLYKKKSTYSFSSHQSKITPL